MNFAMKEIPVKQMIDQIYIDLAKNEVEEKLNLSFNILKVQIETLGLSLDEHSMFALNKQVLRIESLFTQLDALYGEAYLNSSEAYASLIDQISDTMAKLEIKTQKLGSQLVNL